MHLLVLMVVGIILLVAGYFTYGLFISRILRLDNRRATPACTLRDDVDFVPTRKWYLFSQHLSAIAAAGPVVGPILAGMWFGWLPAFLWIIFGGIFIGGVHDLASLVASVRHQGRSIAEVVRVHMSRRAYVLFLLFLWCSLVYSITAFTDITAGTFVSGSEGPQVASSSMMYLSLAVVMGVVLRKTTLSLGIATLLFIPGVFLCIYLGQFFPLQLPAFGGIEPRAGWNVVLLSYCLVAAVVPVWLLLQPRGYLGGFFFTATAAVSFIGILVGTFTQQYLVRYPFFTQWVAPGGLPLLPVLFTTIACGACSGFHAIVASGTTSKQIAKETDTRLIGYGGMLMESFVALIALGTVAILTNPQARALGDPNQIYANGIATFLGALGLERSFALNFALLAFATFVYDTLDVATRLGRYIFQELIGWRGRFSNLVATLATLLLPFFFVTRKVVDANGLAVPAWKVFWTVFGSSNQLLAALVLLAIAAWLFKERARVAVVLVPAVCMLIIAVTSLYCIVRPWLHQLSSGSRMTIGPLVVTVGVLLLLAFLLVIEVIMVFAKRKVARADEV